MKPYRTWTELNAAVMATEDIAVLRVMLAVEQTREGGPREGFVRRMFHRLARLERAALARELNVGPR